MYLQTPPDLIWGFIPPIIFSGVLSALIVILATYLQNRASDSRQEKLLKDQANQQKERLTHDAQMKKSDREMSLKKEIYLQAVEAAGQMSQFLMSFADANNTPQSRTSILKNAGDSLAKIYVIAELFTIQAFVEFERQYRNSLPILLEKRMEFDFKMNQNGSLENINQIIMQRNDKIINNLSPQNGSLPLEVINALNAEFQENLRQVNNNHAKMDELKRDMVIRQVELLKLAFAETSKLQYLGGHCIICLRTEIDLPIDEDKLRNLIENDANEFANIPDFFEKIVDKYQDEI